MLYEVITLLVARLITPVVAAYTLKADPHVTHGDGPVMTRYLKALRWCVTHRGMTRITSYNVCYTKLLRCVR